jgi:glycopeptide antibiotics resistance protein
MRSAGGRADADSGQRQPGRSSRWVQVAALTYVVMLAVVTLLPIHWTLGLARQPSNYEPQLVPFDDVLGGLEDSWVETLAELFGNVLLFAPFGFLPLVAGARRRRGRLAGHRAVPAGLARCA